MTHPHTIDGAPVTCGTLEAAMADDGAGLRLTVELARRLGEPHAGADGRHADEPSPFGVGDLVGTVGAVCVLRTVRADAGGAGVSAICKAPVEGPVQVHALGLVGDQQGDHAYHGGRDKAMYVMDGAEVRHWSTVLGGVEPGRMGENLTIEPGPLGGVDDVELGSVLTVGDPEEGGLRLLVTGVRNPCPTFARGVGRGDWVEVFSARGRVGVYLRVLTEGQVRAGDEVRLETAPGHGVSCRRWFLHHDPRDARALLEAEAAGDLELVPFTRAYVEAAAVEQVG